MSLSIRQRSSLLAILFAGALWLAVFGDKTSSSAVKAVAQPVVRTTATARSDHEIRSTDAGIRKPPLLLELKSREILIRRSPALLVDVFSVRDWTPPPAPMAPVAVEPPTAPSLPYVYVGKKQMDGQWEVYLTRGEMTYIVRQGMNLEGTYVVERIDPPTMRLKYSPLGQAQDLTIGD